MQNSDLTPAVIGLWAKSGELHGHSLLSHMLDVAAVAEVLLDREPASTRQRLGASLGLDWDKARAWVLLLAACHDLGKACAPFQDKWKRGRDILESAGLRFPPAMDLHINHAWVSQIFVADKLTALGWPKRLGELAADALGAHHGERANPTLLTRMRGDRHVWRDPAWSGARDALFEALLGLFRPGEPPMKVSMDGPGFMLLAGLVSFADWIGSSEAWFPFDGFQIEGDLDAWWRARRAMAERAMDALGWFPRTPLFPMERPFQEVFPFPPRPLQCATAEAVQGVEDPCVLLVEAPMGEGKTEAAFYAHGELQRRLGHRGLYVALPTKATGNAMFSRTLAFLREQGEGRHLDLQLLHGATALNEAYQELRLGGVHDPQSDGSVRAGEWFTHRKRALLSEYGVGTVDQALLPILPVRHHFVRLWGLANRVVVFDEVHAYDTYTGTLLLQLVEWLVALGSSVLLLSATLPPGTRRKLAGMLGGSLPESEAPYPRLTLFQREALRQIPFPADPARRRVVEVHPLPADLGSIQGAVESGMPIEGSALVLVNTVQRAQEFYGLYPAGEAIRRNGVPVGKRLPDGTEVLLFHARFPADLRQVREDHALDRFGSRSLRTGRRILIATQVAEQSLDLDFDFMVSDLAPIDLLLQRAGRLWRHARAGRPLPVPRLLVAGLAGSEPPSFGAPLWWGAVYREDVLLWTWCLLQGCTSLALPDEIDALVSRVYEEEVPVPSFLEDRLEAYRQEAEGERYAHRLQALRNTIGSPGDASWNDPGRYTRADEDEPGIHPALQALTRLGDESLTIIPIRAADGFHPEATPSSVEARAWSLRAMSLGRKGVVAKLKPLGVPEGWKSSPFLRHAFALQLDEDGRWQVDPTVRLDEELGLVFENKEAL
nr:CRISPR-associated helicase Cas3' [uncultured Holophaga sp.]